MSELPPAMTVPSIGQLVLWWTEIYDAGGSLYNIEQARWTTAPNARHPGPNDCYFTG